MSKNSCLILCSSNVENFLEKSWRFEEPLKPLLIEGIIYDDDRLIHDVHACINPIQAWIEDPCNGVCLSWNNFVSLGLVHKQISYFGLHIMDILACIYVAFDVSLFWLVIKNKGICHGLDDMSTWLHWVYDFTWHLLHLMLRLG